ncbi:MAG: hypothetical protein K2X93_17815 [Candidatus Obscuribacterales bacterium]|nr:hypothetical protein [Candidatus Obscuribacterales bacterium]
MIRQRPFVLLTSMILLVVPGALSGKAALSPSDDKSAENLSRIIPDDESYLAGPNCPRETEDPFNGSTCVESGGNREERLQKLLYSFVFEENRWWESTRKTLLLSISPDGPQKNFEIPQQCSIGVRVPDKGRWYLACSEGLCQLDEKSGTAKQITLQPDWQFHPSQAFGMTFDSRRNRLVLLSPDSLGHAKNLWSVDVDAGRCAMIGTLPNNAARGLVYCSSRDTYLTLVRPVRGDESGESTFIYEITAEGSISKVTKLSSNLCSSGQFLGTTPQMTLHENTLVVVLTGAILDSMLPRALFIDTADGTCFLMNNLSQHTKFLSSPF